VAVKIMTSSFLGAASSEQDSFQQEVKVLSSLQASPLCSHLSPRWLPFEPEVAHA